MIRANSHEAESIDYRKRIRTGPATRVVANQEQQSNPCNEDQAPAARAVGICMGTRKLLARRYA